MYQGLDGVLLLQRAGAVEADAGTAQGMGAGGVFGAGAGLAGVGEQHQLVNQLLNSRHCTGLRFTLAAIVSAIFKNSSLGMGSLPLALCESRMT